MNARNRLIGIGMSYGAACALPAFGDGSHPTWGIFCLISLPWVLFIPAWYANPLFFAGCVALARGNTPLAANLGLVASLLAASFAVQGGLANLRVGYLAWQLSMVGLATAGFLGRDRRDVRYRLRWRDDIGTRAADGAVQGAPSARSAGAGSSSASSSSAPLSSRSPS